MVDREAFEAFVKSSFVQTKKMGSKVLTRSRGAEIVEGASEEKVLWPTLGEMTAVFKKYKVCTTCLLVDSVSVLIHTFVSYIISYWKLRKCVLGMRLMSPCKM